MIKKSDLESYLKPNQLQEKVQIARMKKSVQNISDFFNDLSNHKIYAYNNEKIFLDFGEILSGIKEKFLITYPIKNSYQNIMFDFSLPHLMLEFFVLDPSKITQDLKAQFFEIFEYFLKENGNSQGLFFQNYYFTKVAIVLDNFPSELIEFFLNSFKNYKTILLRNIKALDLFMSVFEKFLNEEKFELLNGILNIYMIYMDSKEIAHFSTLPIFDLKIAHHLKTIIEKVNFDLLKTALENHQIETEKFSLPGEKISFNNEINFKVNIIKTFSKSIKYRFEDFVYSFIVKKFTKELLMDLIHLSGVNFEFRLIFLYIFENLYIDPKDHLINHRNNYYHIKPKDPNYDEDIFYDTDYRVVIDVIREEIEFCHGVHNSEEIGEVIKESLAKYFIQGPIRGAAKLGNYFSGFNETDLLKLNPIFSHIKQLDVFFQHRTSYFYIFL